MVIKAGFRIMSNNWTDFILPFPPSPESRSTGYGHAPFVAE